MTLLCPELNSEKGLHGHTALCHIVCLIVIHKTVVRADAVLIRTTVATQRLEGDSRRLPDNGVFMFQKRGDVRDGSPVADEGEGVDDFGCYLGISV